MVGLYNACAVAACVVLGYIAVRRRKTKSKAPTAPAGDLPREGAHNLPRMAMIARGRPSEFSAEQVALRRLADFDLDSTIFKSVSSPLSRLVLDARLSQQPFFSSHTALAIAAEFALVRPKLTQEINANGPIIDFLQTHCSFSQEHADGSFMDHLQFCHDYSAVHFPAHSPRVLLLHSFLGVGTNIFPMEARHSAPISTTA